MNLAEPVFYSIQGEGPRMGKPSCFVRFSGCCLRCPYCDTKYSWNVDKGEKVNIGDLEKIVFNIIERGFSDIVITGGEPLVNVDECGGDFFYFLDLLFVNDVKITLETTMLTKQTDIFYSSIHDNYHEMLDLLGMKTISNCIFVVSPKLSIESYRNNDITFKDISDFYSMELDSMVEINKYSNLFYKFIYNNDKQTEDKIKQICDSLPDSFLYNSVFIMPFTELPFDEEKYKRSCNDTVEFCIKNNLRYSPRIHIDLWGNAKGV